MTPPETRCPLSENANQLQAANAKITFGRRRRLLLLPKPFVNHT